MYLPGSMPASWQILPVPPSPASCASWRAIASAQASSTLRALAHAQLRPEDRPTGSYGRSARLRSGGLRRPAENGEGRTKIELCPCLGRDSGAETVATRSPGSTAPLAVHEARRRLEVAVQDKRVEVCAVWPYDGSELVVHLNLRKEVGIGKGLEHKTM